MHRITEWIENARRQKNARYDDLDKIVRRIVARYGELFPKYSRTRSGSKTVHHFNVPGIMPISLEKEHGSREFLPPRYKTLALDGLDSIVAYIESRAPATKEADPGEEDEKG